MRGTKSTLSKYFGYFQACCAFAFITIPSLNNVCSKLRLYLMTSQVGFLSRCLGQAEDCIAAAVTLLQDAAAATQVQRHTLVS